MQVNPQLFASKSSCMPHEEFPLNSGVTFFSCKNTHVACLSLELLVAIAAVIVAAVASRSPPPPSKNFVPDCLVRQ